MIPANQRLIPFERASQSPTFASISSRVPNSDLEISSHYGLSTSASLSRPLGSCPDVIKLKHTSCTIKPQISLSRYTSYRVGGVAEFFSMPRTPEEMQASLAWANKHSVPVTLLGAGSNLLISDRGLEGLVICTRHLRKTTFEDDTGRIMASSGELLARLAWQAAERGWSGLEWAIGIPGTVGGAVAMNAGAHSWCTADVFVNAETLDDLGNLKVFRTEELKFDYRTSLLQRNPLFVTQASFQLSSEHDPKDVIAETRRHLKQRHQTQPYHLPSCGSVFRNPSSQKAGWLIEQTGLKGYQIGGAQVAQQHANFILNVGHASSQDIFSLIQHIQEQVKNRWSLLLKPEVKFVGEF